MTIDGHACRHAKPPEMGYMEAHSDAERRRKRGEHQSKCQACGLYVWEYLFRKTQEGRK